MPVVTKHGWTWIAHTKKYISTQIQCTSLQKSVQHENRPRLPTHSQSEEMTRCLVTHPRIPQKRHSFSLVSITLHGGKCGLAHPRSPQKAHFLSLCTITRTSFTSFKPMSYARVIFRGDTKQNISFTCIFPCAPGCLLAICFPMPSIRSLCPHSLQL